MFKTVGNFYGGKIKMNRRIIQGIEDSAFDFNRHVRRLLAEELGGEIRSIEDEKRRSEILEKFDLLGIDAFQIRKGEGMKGIASRMTYGEYDPCFTIRYAYYDGTGDVENCEFQKKLRALEKPEQHWFFPHFTVQARCTERRVGELKWAILVNTDELIHFVDRNRQERKVVGRGFHKGDKFYIVEAGALVKAGIKVKVLARTK